MASAAGSPLVAQVPGGCVEHLSKKTPWHPHPGRTATDTPRCWRGSPSERERQCNTPAGPFTRRYFLHFFWSLAHIPSVVRNDAPRDSELSVIRASRSYPKAAAARLRLKTQRWSRVHRAHWPERARAQRQCLALLQAHTATRPGRKRLRRMKRMPHKEGAAAKLPRVPPALQTTRRCHRCRAETVRRRRRVLVPGKRQDRFATVRS